jgi:streptogramin lyase
VCGTFVARPIRHPKQLHRAKEAAMDDSARVSNSALSELEQQCISSFEWDLGAFRVAFSQSGHQWKRWMLPTSNAHREELQAYLEAALNAQGNPTAVD